MSKKKPKRRFIRVNGRLVTSPRFDNASDAERWYVEMRRRKQLVQDGIVADDRIGPTVIEYARKWTKRRMANYPKATWGMDEQRMRDYILPTISEMKMSEITGATIRNLLIHISEVGYLRPDFRISISTRKRVQALLSSFFGDALNEDPPLVQFNPALGIKIKERRVGQFKPKFLADTKQCLDFLKSAKDLSELHFSVACTFLMSGIRKQELIALKWKSINFKTSQFLISEKYAQADQKIVPGTKSGSNITRPFPVSQELIGVLLRHRENTPFNTSEDFVFSNSKGHFLLPRYVWSLIKDIAVAAKVHTNPHALRHTFGREFAANTGNLKALQAILGHSSSQTTDIYSNLDGERLKVFGEAVSFQVPKDMEH